MEDDKPNENLHAGHRERLRERATNEGIDGFADHEVLELLLFSVIPRANTNPLAHRLLTRFGSLSAVLEADPLDLATVDGVGDRGGAFLATIPAISRRYMHDRVAHQAPCLTDPANVSDYLVPLMGGRPEEVIYLLCLDVQYRVKFPALLSSGTVTEAYVHRRHVVEAALRHRAASVILAHNHPSGNAMPSQADIDLTMRLVAALAAVDIPLLDHVIVAGEETFSFQDAQMMPNQTDRTD